MKSNEHNRLIVLIVILAMVLSVFVYFYGKSFVRPVSNQAVAPVNSSQIYTSKSLNFSIQLPYGYYAEEKFTRVVIQKDQQHQIIIDRSGTNFDNLKDYLADIKVKNKTVFLSQRKLENSNGLDGEVVLAEFSGIPSGKKIIYLYKDFFVYMISSENDILADDLDQIAGSFRYIGE